MITVQQAEQIINARLLHIPSKVTPLLEAHGKILREDLFADRDFPPFNRVMMDGIALRVADFSTGQRTFFIEGVAPAGSPQMTLQQAGNCLEVMTGCMLPNGVDAVIPYEEIEIADGKATVHIDAISTFQNIHPQGKDQAKGALVISKNTRIGAGEIAVAATIGKTELLVAELPKVLLISTGDELVDVSETPLPHQIRRSNSFMLSALLAENGIDSAQVHLNDNKATLREKLAKYMQHYRIIMLSGGVSKGKYDFVPEVLESLGVEKLFHRVKQRPGKPFWFGQAPNSTTFFALPGNPVSSLVCAKRYFLPWLQKSIGQALPPRYATLTERIEFKKSLTLFQQVQLTSAPDGRLLASPLRGHGSGDLMSLIGVNGFVELPADKTVFEAGEVVKLL